MTLLADLEAEKVAATRRFMELTGDVVRERDAYREKVENYAASINGRLSESVRKNSPFGQFHVEWSTMQVKLETAIHHALNAGNEMAELDMKIAFLKLIEAQS